MAHGVVPQDAVVTALSSPFKIDVSPLAPGLGLLLDEIRWWDLPKGSYEARVMPSARGGTISIRFPACPMTLSCTPNLEASEHVLTALASSRVAARMEAFKEEVVYPHIHSLISESSVTAAGFELAAHGKGCCDAHPTPPHTNPHALVRCRWQAFEDFMAYLTHNDGYEHHYSSEDYERLRRINSHWDVERERLVRERAETREARMAAKRAEEAELAAKGDAAASEVTLRPKSQRTGKRRSDDIPGGVLTTVCIQWGLVPGPRTHEMMEHLREQLASGVLQPQQPTTYYLEALERVFPRPRHAGGEGYGTLESCEVEVLAR